MSTKQDFSIWWSSAGTEATEDKCLAVILRRSSLALDLCLHLPLRLCMEVYRNSLFEWLERPRTSNLIIRLLSGVISSRFVWVDMRATRGNLIANLPKMCHLSIPSVRGIFPWEFRMRRWGTSWPEMRLYAAGWPELQRLVMLIDLKRMHTIGKVVVRAWLADKVEHDLRRSIMEIIDITIK
jgi:hypothetical protein